MVPSPSQRNSWAQLDMIQTTPATLTPQNGFQEKMVMTIDCWDVATKEEDGGKHRQDSWKNYEGRADLLRRQEELM